MRNNLRRSGAGKLLLPIRLRLILGVFNNIPTIFLAFFKLVIKGRKRKKSQKFTSIWFFALLYTFGIKKCKKFWFHGIFELLERWGKVVEQNDKILNFNFSSKLGGKFRTTQYFFIRFYRCYCNIRSLTVTSKMLISHFLKIFKILDVKPQAIGIGNDYIVTSTFWTKEYGKILIFDIIAFRIIFPLLNSFVISFHKYWR